MFARIPFCTGNCHGTYKWGSTNAYLEDDAGNPTYDGRYRSGLRHLA